MKQSSKLKHAMPHLATISLYAASKWPPIWPPLHPKLAHPPPPPLPRKKASALRRSISRRRSRRRASSISARRSSRESPQTARSCSGQWSMCTAALDSSFRDSWFVIRFVVVVNFAFVYERTTTSIRSSRKTISTPSMEEMQNRTLKIQQLSQKSNSEITSFKVYFCSQNLRPSNRLLAVLHQSLVHV